MQKNEISDNQLNADAQEWIDKLRQVLLIQSKGKGTVKSYTAEMILLFKYYNSKEVASITQADIEQYIVYIKTVHKVGRAKCRSLASACAFFYKLEIKKPYLLPSALYPQKQFILPNIMSQQEVAQLFAAPLSLKEYCVIGFQAPDSNEPGIFYFYLSDNDFLRGFSAIPLNVWRSPYISVNSLCFKICSCDFKHYTIVYDC